MSMGIGKFSISATVRESAKTLSALRRSGQLPAVVYGKEAPSQAIALDSKEFYKTYKQAGASSLVNLQLDAEDRIVLFKDLQFDPKTHDVVHVDLYQIKLGEKIRTDIPLSFINTAPAVEEFEGVLITNRDKVEIECLPKDLPHEIEVDLSTLAQLDDSILVKDLKLPAGVEVLDDVEDMIVVVNAPREEEAEPVVSEADAVAGVAVEGDADDAGDADASEGGEDTKDKADSE